MRSAHRVRRRHDAPHGRSPLCRISRCIGPGERGASPLLDVDSKVPLVPSSQCDRVVCAEEDSSDTCDSFIWASVVRPSWTIAGEARRFRRFGEDRRNRLTTRSWRSGSRRRCCLLSGFPESATTVGPVTLHIQHCQVVIPDTVAVCSSGVPDRQGSLTHDGAMVPSGHGPNSFVTASEDDRLHRLCHSRGASRHGQQSRIALSSRGPPVKGASPVGRPAAPSTIYES